VIAGPALVTQSNMAGLPRPDPVRGGGGRRVGSLPGAFIASLLIGLVADLRGVDQRLAVRAVRPAQPAYAQNLAFRHLERDRGKIAPIIPT